MESEALLGTTPKLFHPTMGAESIWHGIGVGAAIAGAALLTWWGAKMIVTGKKPWGKSQTSYALSA